MFKKKKTISRYTDYIRIQVYFYDWPTQIDIFSKCTTKRGSRYLAYLWDLKGSNYAVIIFGIKFHGPPLMTS